MVKVSGVPSQDVEPLVIVGVTVMVAVIGKVSRLFAVKEGISSTPLAAKPMAKLSLVQLNVVPGSDVENKIVLVFSLLQKITSFKGFT